MHVQLTDKAKLIRASILAERLDCTSSQAKMAKLGMIIDIEAITPELHKLVEPVSDVETPTEVVPDDGSAIEDQEDED